MGVENIWLIDPEKREAFAWESKEKFWRPSKQLQVEGTPVYLDLDWVWDQISQK